MDDGALTLEEVKMAWSLDSLTIYQFEATLLKNAFKEMLWKNVLRFFRFCIVAFLLWFVWSYTFYLYFGLNECYHCHLSVTLDAFNGQA